VNGVRFGILGFDDVAAYAFEATEDEPGTAPLDDDYTEELAAGEPSFFRPAEELSLNRFQSTIESLAADVDVVLVQVQSGTEETHIPSVRSLKALPIAVTAGATVVIGNQAHWVQAVDYAPDNFVAYALGNFIFDQTRAPEFTEGVLAETIFHGDRLVNIRLRPYVIVDQYRPEFVAGERELKILGDIYEASGGLPPR
jgi:poly-gamma-glutamate capsule biosynthesis protein CapA/YwtB (metallophosphatase superfamily)